MPVARSIRITGHVQGVFFREWTIQVANQLGIAGWVRNNSDGSVEVYAEGMPVVIDRFIVELGKGSPASRVDDLEMHPAVPEGLSSFVRRSNV